MADDPQRETPGSTSWAFLFGALMNNNDSEVGHGVLAPSSSNICWASLRLCAPSRWLAFER